MQGVPAIVINRGRRVVQPLQPKMVGPFDSKSTVPTPGEPRAVQHIREKVDQRTRNSNDKKPELQLRDALLLHDHAKDGKISQGAFRQVLERYNVFLSQAEFSQIVEVYGSQGAHLPRMGNGLVYHSHRPPPPPFIPIARPRPRSVTF